MTCTVSLSGFFYVDVKNRINIESVTSTIHSRQEEKYEQTKFVPRFLYIFEMKGMQHTLNFISIFDNHQFHTVPLPFPSSFIAFIPPPSFSFPV